MNEVESRDGTPIAYEKRGSGPALILVDGAFGSRTMGPNGPLAPLLAERFTVYTYDRRGRGDSGRPEDDPALAVSREVEDIEALIGAAGGSAYLYGVSSGAVLALEAAARLASVRKLALYEAPLVVDDSRAAVPERYLADMTDLVTRERRSDAIRLFMKTGVGLPSIVVALMRLMPAWRKMKAVAHTLPYDVLLTVELQRGTPLPGGSWAAATQPTLVICGGKSPAWMRNGMHALAEVLPNARLQTLEGQTHLVKPKALAPLLLEFFGAESAARSEVGAVAAAAGAGL
jgi:pimeloyl-ACP methyl ester carboxylesterase